MRLGEPRMMQGQSIIILKEGTARDRGKGAQFNNIAAARAVADAVRSTLGPRGMDKMLVDSLGDVTITNDGVTILKEIEVEHPAAKMIVEVAKTQDQEAGDGTTTAVILAGELLKEAESLLEANVHPTTIAKGYQLAADQAIEILKDIAFPVKPGDKEILTQIATTAMGGRAIGDARSYLADLVVRAILAVTDEVAGARVADVENVKVEKKHGHQITDTQLIDGLVLDMEALSRATGGRVVTALEDLGPKDLGRAKVVEERKIGDDEMTFFTGCKNPKSVSILIRGGTEHVVEEVERIMHDALRVVASAVEDGTALAGGGSADIEVSMRLRDVASRQGGREQLAIEAFAKALEVVPWTLAENAGLNMIDMIIDLKAAHEGKKGASVGIDVFKGKPADMRKAGVIEPLRVKAQAIKSATEVAAMILRIDDVIASRRSEGGKEGGGPEHGGMPPGMGGMGGMGM